jgi:TATA-box binding protein (TBP) (component of TFIID and TFIIIB)
MEFVSNANYKGDIDELIDLEELSRKIPNSVLHKRPRQLIVKDAKGTLVLFASGKFRTMGCIDCFEASSLACKYLDKAMYPFISFPFIDLQSYTLNCQLGFYINLEKMASSGVPCVYEPELFPALRLKQYKPVCVNVFTTGKVVICGLKDLQQVHDIIDYLRTQSEPYKY